MGKISFRCPECRRRLRASQDKAGKVAKCPRCGCTLSIPTAEAESETVTPVAFGGRDIAILVMFCATTLLIFVGWILYRSTAETQIRIRVLLAPDEKGRLLNQITELRAKTLQADSNLQLLRNETEALRAELKRGERDVTSLKEEEARLTEQRDGMAARWQPLGLDKRALDFIKRSEAK